MFAGLLGASNNESSNEGNAIPGFLDMGLISKAVDKILKFNTEK
jgi:hypothetical protein